MSAISSTSNGSVKHAKTWARIAAMTSPLVAAGHSAMIRTEGRSNDNSLATARLSLIELSGSVNNTSHGCWRSSRTAPTRLAQSCRSCSRKEAWARNLSNSASLRPIISTRPM